MVRVVTFQIRNNAVSGFSLAYHILDLNRIVVSRFSLSAGGLPDLSSECRQIVANFDVETLNPRRIAATKAER
jgi:hypothetical protein